MLMLDVDINYEYAFIHVIAQYVKIASILIKFRVFSIGRSLNL